MPANEFDNHGFVTIPPDSTGKNLSTLVRIDISYVSGITLMVKGQTVTGASSGASATVLNVRGTVTSGDVTVIMRADSATPSWTDGELIQVNAVTVATVSTSVKSQSQEFVIVGQNNPLQGQFVDSKGNAFIRFSEGEQQMDAFGLTRTTQPVTIAQFQHQYGILDGEFSHENSGSGAGISHDANESAVLLDIGTPSASFARSTTDRYHLYQPGIGQLAQMAVASGDTGKANVVRQWGYYDANDGVFFKHSGSLVNVVQRSSVTGVPVDTVVSQSAWNGDRVDGTGGANNLSEMALGIDTLNIYWMDVAWLGAGRARMGVYAPNGDRITCHVFENANSSAAPWMKQANLPVRYEIFNEAIAASPSRLKFVCSMVATEGPALDERSRRTLKFTTGSLENKIASASVDVPIMSFRSAALVNGITNRKISVPELLCMRAADQPIVVTIFKNSSLTSGSFKQIIMSPVSSALEMDTSATSLTGGQAIASWMIQAENVINTELPKNFGIRGENMHLPADVTSSVDIYTFAARSLNTGSNARTDMCLTWIDVI